MKALKEARLASVNFSGYRKNREDVVSGSGACDSEVLHFWGDHQSPISVLCVPCSAGSCCWSWIICFAVLLSELPMGIMQSMLLVGYLGNTVFCDFFPHRSESGRESLSAWNLMQLCKSSAGACGTARPGATEHWHQQLCGDYYSFLILILMYSEIEDTTFSLAFHRTEDSSVLPVTQVWAVDTWVQACFASPQLLMGQTIIWYIYFPCTLTYTPFVVAVVIILR